MKVTTENYYSKTIYEDGIYTIVSKIGDATYTVKPTKSEGYYKITLKNESGIETTIRTRCKIDTALRIADEKAAEYFDMKSAYDSTATAQESESDEESEKAAEEYEVVRYFFPHGIEGEPMSCTIKYFDSREKAEAYAKRYAKGIRFAGCEINFNGKELAYLSSCGDWFISEEDSSCDTTTEQESDTKSGITEVTDESGNMELVDSDGEVIVRVERTSDSEVCIVEFAGRDGTKHRTLRPWFTDAVEYARWKADRIVLHKSYNLPVDFGLEYETEERWQDDMEKHGIIEYHPENAPDIVVEYLSAGDCSSLSAVYDHHRGITVRRIRRLHAATYVFDSLEEAIDRARMSAIDEAHRRAGVRRTIFGK